MAELPPLPDIFGNYTIRGISEVLAPETISWLPTAPGWRAVSLALLLLLGWKAWLYWRKWLRNRYRRAALKQLNHIINLHSNSLGLLDALSTLLKATALQAYPRVEVARLSGDSWLRWLNDHGDGARFSSRSATLLGESVYQAHNVAESADLRRLLREVSHWISSHREADCA
ncbi:MAG: DUF4381 domain-containing protein [Gammaproteobacteria bacterium]|nr:DUF4381 domain-containing protein [Gammaproteobacteria bacterium]